MPETPTHAISGVRLDHDNGAHLSDSFVPRPEWIFGAICLGGLSHRYGRKYSAVGAFQGDPQSLFSWS